VSILRWRNHNDPEISLHIVVFAGGRFSDGASCAAHRSLAANKCDMERPPPELELNQRYAEAAVLYFSPDRRFVLVYATVIQGPTSEAISGGDGRVVYFGTWKLTGNSLHVEYD